MEVDSISDSLLFLILKIRHLIFILPSSIMPIKSSELITLLLSYHLSLNQ